MIDRLYFLDPLLHNYTWHLGVVLLLQQIASSIFKRENNFKFSHDNKSINSRHNNNEMQRPPETDQEDH